MPAGSVAGSVSTAGSDDAAAVRPAARSRGAVDGPRGARALRAFADRAAAHGWGALARAARAEASLLGP